MAALGPDVLQLPQEESMVEVCRLRRESVRAVQTPGSRVAAASSDRKRPCVTPQTMLACILFVATMPAVSAFQHARLAPAGALVRRTLVPPMPTERPWVGARRAFHAHASTTMAMPMLYGQGATGGFILGAYSVSAFTFCFLLAFETMLWDQSWRAEFEKPRTRALWWSGVRSSLLNYVFLAPAAKGLATAFVMSRAAPYLNPCLAFPGVLLCQAVGYALAHEFMHRPQHYRWTGHQYHHQFNEKTFVRPISANAVTAVEFLIAYAIPLMVGIVLFRPSPVVADSIICAVSLANLCIHTPEKVLPMRCAPPGLVSNRKHLYHHQVDVTRFLSAPIIDLDDWLRSLGLGFGGATSENPRRRTGGGSKE